MIDPTSVKDRSLARPLGRRVKRGVLVAGVLTVGAMASAGFAYGASPIPALWRLRY